MRSNSARFDVLSGKELLLDRPPGNATDLLRRVPVVVNGRRQRLVPAVRAIVRVGGLAVQTRAVSVSVDALFTAYSAVVQVPVRGVMFEKRIFVYDRVPGLGVEHLRVVVEVFYGAGAAGVEDFPLSLLARRVPLDVPGS